MVQLALILAVEQNRHYINSARPDAPVQDHRPGRLTPAWRKRRVRVARARHNSS
jgi:hypothetical protein